ncbi:MAG TPA: hypothetical protein DCZ20_05630, partial [Lachnospiraceae bacterium]|nr:hypothetical protein [Lachnospiraceae bacterium]
DSCEEKVNSVSKRNLQGALRQRLCRFFILLQRMSGYKCKRRKKIKLVQNGSIKFIPVLIKYILK